MELIRKTLPKKKRIFIPVLILAFVFFLVFIFNFIQGNSNASLNKQVVVNSETPTAEASIASLNKQVVVNSEIPIAEASVLSVKKEVSLGLPVNLKIPSINANATVLSVGLTPEGAMDSPVGPAEAGWYNLGPRPGEQGSAVIDGHSGWKGGIPAVFDDLYKVKIGDKIYVKDDKGVTITFIVREVRTYSPNADASNVFVSNDDKSHLNLITCTGFWNKILKSHSDRLVVFADRE